MRVWIQGPEGARIGTDVRLRCEHNEVMLSLRVDDYLFLRQGGFVHVILDEMAVRTIANQVERLEDGA